MHLPSIIQADEFIVGLHITKAHLPWVKTIITFAKHFIQGQISHVPLFYETGKMSFSQRIKNLRKSIEMNVLFFTYQLFID